MCIVDTGLSALHSRHFAQSILHLDPTLTVKCAPASESSATRCRLIGGIMVIISEEWASSVGDLHQDNSRLGILAKFQLRGAHTDQYTMEKN